MSVASRQLLYTAAPLSLLVFLNLLNRRRFEQMTEQNTAIAIAQLDRRLSKHVELLNQQISTLPTPEAVGSLQKSMLRQNQQALSKLSSEITNVQQEMQQRLSTLERQGIDMARQDIARLKEQYGELCESLETMTTSLNRLSPSGRVEDVESAITQLKNEVVQIRVNLQNLTQQTRPNLNALQDQVTNLNRQMQRMPPPYDPTSLKQEVGELIKVVANLVPKRDWNFLVSDMQALQKEQEQLKQSLTSSSDSHAQAEARLQKELQNINQQLQSLAVGPEYEFIFDLNTADSTTNSALTGSRRVLEEALENTQERLILIWPWLDQLSLDDAMIAKLEAFLQKNRRLDLGWCHLADRNEDRFVGGMRRRWAIAPANQTLLQDTLQKLLQLKQAYPNQFQFKILGTKESFLVSDQTVAVLGIDSTLSTNTVFSDLGLKLRTSNPAVVQQLIQRFDHPNLDTSDGMAHWNRAATRYELGDLAGAIADFTQVLAINPEDAVAYNYRGLVRYELDDSAGAIADFCESIALEPDQAAAFCNRAFVRSEMEDYYGAIADYSLAIQARPEAAIAYFYRGMACQKLGNPRGALSDYNEALHLAPNSATTYYYRGMVQQRMGAVQGAIADLERAAKLFTRQGNPAYAQKALNGLSKLRQLKATPQAQPALLQRRA